jgi:poly(A) polymerase
MPEMRRGKGMLARPVECSEYDQSLFILGLKSSVKKVIQAAKRFLRRGQSTTVVQPKIIKANEHRLIQGAISQHALDILHKLVDSHFKAYLVGGGIRDALCGLKPKDFDVATNATPEQVRKLFRNSRIIGKRFRLVHIFYGREIIEVATFRSAHPTTDSASHSTKEGMILRDNVYGTIDEDAIRRDFTVNALYYDVKTQALLDFVDGYSDLDKRVLRLIGDPEQRYREDPVRLIRAIRFAAKLGFAIEKNTEKPIKSMAPLLANISHARLYEEVRKLFLSGHAEQTLALLIKYELFQYLFGQTWQCMQLPDGQMAVHAFLSQTCIDTDTRLAEHKRVTGAFFIAAFLWHPFEQQLIKISQQQPIHLHTMMQVCKQILQIQHKQTVIPARISSFIQDIWTLQFRLTRLKASSAVAYVNMRAFRAGYDFLLLRAKVAKTIANQSKQHQAELHQRADHLQAVADWWGEFQVADTEQQNHLLTQFPGQKTIKKRRRKKKKVQPDHQQTNS